MEPANDDRAAGKPEGISIFEIWKEYEKVFEGSQLH